MRASTRSRYGGPEVITVKDMPIPSPKKNEIRIQVKATTINRTDCGGLWGLPKIYRLFVGWPKPRHAVTGTDFAGVVDAVGANVTRFKVGDRVWGFDDNSMPSHAEYMVISEKKPIEKIPDNTSYTDAAASAEGAHYAINFLNKVEVKAGQLAMVNGGTGGIGSALIQLLKEKGLEVTATCRTEHKEAVLALGADRVIDYTQEDFTKEEGFYDFVFDTVGKSTFGACKQILKPDGVYISSELGPGNENLYLPLTTQFGKQKVKFPMPSNISHSLKIMGEMLEKEAYKPLIDRTYPLEKIAEAFDYVHKGQKVGNVLITME